MLQVTLGKCPHHQFADTGQSEDRQCRTKKKQRINYYKNYRKVGAGTECRGQQARPGRICLSRDLSDRARAAISDVAGPCVSVRVRFGVRITWGRGLARSTSTALYPNECLRAARASRRRPSVISPPYDTTFRRSLSTESSYSCVLFIISLP